MGEAGVAHIGVLGAGLADKYPYLRVEAAFALRRVGEAGRAEAGAVAERLTEKDGDVRRGALVA